MKRANKPLAVGTLVSLQVMDARASLLGKVQDTTLTAKNICIPLSGENEAEAIHCISWKDVQAAMSVSRFFQYFATHTQYSKGHVLVSEADGTAVGFAKLAEFHVRGAKFGCILGVAVDPQFRRKGIATALVNTATNCLKSEGAEAVFATVTMRNAASLAVFKKQGFSKMSFLRLWRLFGWRVFRFYKNIYYGFGEIVLMLQLYN